MVLPTHLLTLASHILTLGIVVKINKKNFSLKHALVI